MSIAEIHEITMIDEWFLAKLENLARYELEIEGKPLSKEQYLKGKKLGYPDKALEKISGGSLHITRTAFIKWLTPAVLSSRLKRLIFTQLTTSIARQESLTRAIRKK